MTCPYCHGSPPSTDGRTECGWCQDGALKGEWWQTVPPVNGATPDGTDD